MSHNDKMNIFLVIIVRILSVQIPLLGGQNNKQTERSCYRAVGEKSLWYEGALKMILPIKVSYILTYFFGF